MKISEKSNGRIIEKWLKFPSSHSDQRNRSMNFTPAFFRRFKDLEPMLTRVSCVIANVNRLNLQQILLGYSITRITSDGTDLSYSQRFGILAQTSK